MSLRNRQRYFDSDFNAKVGESVRGLSRDAKLLLLGAYILAAIYATIATGSLAVALALLLVVGFAVLGVNGSTDPEPDPSQSTAPSDHASEARESYIESGAGEIAYESARSTLRALVGDEVSVVAMSLDGEPSVTVHGRLTSPINVSDDANEHLLFNVGTGGGFYMPRAKFIDGTAELERNDIDGGLCLVVGDMKVWIFELAAT